MKPILFNTEMVRAILDGRKTVTRRVIKPQPKEYQRIIFDTARKEWAYTIGKSVFVDRLCKTRYRPGDILYVQETWAPVDGGGYIYRAGFGVGKNVPLWNPSTRMPKEAARIFLRVTDVRVERLQDITAEQCVSEGLGRELLDEVGADFMHGMYHDLWDSTIKPKDLDIYGWDANPWVEVTEFERMSREEAENDDRRSNRST